MSADNWAQCPTCYNGQLREDWEIGTDKDGWFSVKYKSSCGSCGYKYQYRHQEHASNQGT